MTFELVLTNQFKTIHKNLYVKYFLNQNDLINFYMKKIDKIITIMATKTITIAQKWKTSNDPNQLHKIKTIN